MITNISHNFVVCIRSSAAKLLGVRTFRGTECISQGNDFELIPTIKILALICYRCGVMAAWIRQNCKILGKFLRFFRKTTPYNKIFKILFGKFTSRTDRRYCVQNSWKLSDGKLVKSCVIYLTKKYKFRLPLKLLGSRPKSAMANPRHLAHYLTMFQISSKSVHFRRSYIRPREGRQNAP